MLEYFEQEKPVCNMCAEDIQYNEYGYLDEHVKIEKRWGYGSTLDNQIHNICICESCYQNIFNSLKIKPKVLNLL